MLNGLLAKDNFWFSSKLLDRLQARSSTFSSLSVTAKHDFVETTTEGNRSVPGVFVSGDYFKTLQSNAQLGRLLTPVSDFVHRRGAQAVRNDQSTVFQPSQAWASTWLIRYSGNPAGIATQTAEEMRGARLKSEFGWRWVPINGRCYGRFRRRIWPWS